MGPFLHFFVVRYSFSNSTKLVLYTRLRRISSTLGFTWIQYHHCSASYSPLYPPTIKLSPVLLTKKVQYSSTEPQMAQRCAPPRWQSATSPVPRWESEVEDQPYTIEIDILCSSVLSIDSHPQKCDFSIRIQATLAHRVDQFPI
jgi:hypothetical protein